MTARLTMRISVELDRADNPPLYDDLAQFPKGSRRVNRLRTLAHAGLALQQPARHGLPSAASPGAMAAASPLDSENAAATLASIEIFGPSLKE